MNRINNWHKQRGIDFLHMVGLRKGQTILDCFCGEGNFTIPAARIAGISGLVYAMDRDSYKIRTLRERAAETGMHNLEIIEEEFTDKLPFDTNSIDTVLLYDVFWYYSPDDLTLALLIEELYRILTEDGLLSVYPEHIDCDNLRSKIMDHGFILDRDFRAILMHDNSLKEGYVMNFKKEIFHLS